MDSDVAEIVGGKDRSQCGGNVQKAALVLKREATAQVNITCDQLMETNK
eukprot:COSAG01_NODE_5952_length_3937_cov_22.825169_4_plen_49_part_00